MPPATRTLHGGQIGWDDARPRLCCARTPAAPPVLVGTVGARRRARRVAHRGGLLPVAVAEQFLARAQRDPLGLGGRMHPGPGRVDEQLRARAEGAAGRRGREDQPAQVAGRDLREHRDEPHPARRPGVLHRVHVPTHPPLGRQPGGGVVAGGDVRRARRRRPHRSGGGRCAVRRHGGQPVHRRVQRGRPVRAGLRGPVCGQPPGFARRPRPVGAALVQLGAQQTPRDRDRPLARHHRAAQVRPAGRQGRRGRLRLVVLQLGRRHRLPGVRVLGGGCGSQHLVAGHRVRGRQGRGGDPRHARRAGVRRGHPDRRAHRRRAHGRRGGGLRTRLPHRQLHPGRDRRMDHLPRPVPQPGPRGPRRRP